MKASLIFRISRLIRFLLTGVGKMETGHYLFTLPGPVSDVGLYSSLADCGWQPNHVGFIYKGQIYQCRRLVDRGRHQYHVRFYQDGRVTGHFEIAPEWSARAHLAGVDLRTMTTAEAESLREQAGVI